MSEKTAELLPPPRFASARSILALILREVATHYGRSVGGYVWAILEPLGMILLLALGFSLIVHAPPLGNDFLFFYATGFLPFHCYQQVSLLVARAIRFSRPLLFYPAVSWIDAVLARFILTALTCITVAIILFTGLALLADRPILIETGPILWGFGLALLLGFGLGCINCAVSGLFPTWDLIWSIATRPLFLASGIFYTFETLPQNVQAILWFNPLLHVSGLVRSGFFPMYKPDYASGAYVLGLALICIALGLMLLRRHHRDILQDG